MLHSPFETALEAAVDELRRVRLEEEDLKARLEETQNKNSRIRRLIDELVQVVPEDHWPPTLVEFLGYNQQIQLQLDIGSPAYSEMLRIVFGARGKLWSADEVEAMLSAHGMHVPRKYISNTFSRLVAKGAMRKLSRGHYVVEGDREIEFFEDHVVIKPKHKATLAD